MIASNLRRGLMAGLLAGLFAFFLGEPCPEWDVRRPSSLGTRLGFWMGLGVVFGLLCERADLREPFRN